MNEERKEKKEKKDTYGKLGVITKRVYDPMSIAVWPVELLLILGALAVLIGGAAVLISSIFLAVVVIILVFLLFSGGVLAAIIVFAASILLVAMGIIIGIPLATAYGAYELYLWLYGIHYLLCLLGIILSFFVYLDIGLSVRYLYKRTGEAFSKD